MPATRPRRAGTGGLAYLGARACFAAAGGLLYYLARHDRPALALIGACFAVVGLGRWAFLRARSRRGSVP